MTSPAAACQSMAAPSSAPSLCRVCASATERTPVLEERRIDPGDLAASSTSIPNIPSWTPGLIPSQVFLSALVKFRRSSSAPRGGSGWSYEPCATSFRRTGTRSQLCGRCDSYGVCNTCACVCVISLVNCCWQILTVQAREWPSPAIDTTHIFERTCFRGSHAAVPSEGRCPDHLPVRMVAYLAGPLRTKRQFSQLVVRTFYKHLEEPSVNTDKIWDLPLSDILKLK